MFKALRSIELNVSAWMLGTGFPSVRMVLGTLFFWFGIIKLFPGISPAQNLASQTIATLTLGRVPVGFSLPLLAIWECLIGLDLITRKWTRLGIALLLAQMIGTILPVAFFPEVAFARIPTAPAVGGQDIVKDLILIGAGIVLGTVVAKGRKTADRPLSEKSVIAAENVSTPQMCPRIHEWRRGLALFLTHQARTKLFKETTMTSKLRMICGIAGAGVLALSVMAAVRKGKPAEHKKAAVQTGTPVEVETATLGTVVRTTPVTGSLVSLDDVALSSKIAGRLAKVLVREGDSVNAGQVVAKLDTSDLESQVRSSESAVAAAAARVAQADAALRQQLVSSGTGIDSAEAAYRQQQVTTKAGIESAEAAYNQQLISTRSNIESAQSGLKSAKAFLSQVQEGSRKQDISRAETQVSIAKANWSKADADARRYSELAKEGAVATSTAEQFVTSADVAREQLKSAEQSLSLVKEGSRSQELIQAEQNVRQAEERLRQAEAGKAQDAVRKADLQAARAAAAQIDVKWAAVKSARAGKAQDDVRKAEVQSARAALQQSQSALSIARQALSDAAIISPVSGQIASRSADPGQVIAPGAPILRVVSLNAVCFEPAIPEKEMDHVRVGQPVEISVDAFPGKTFTGGISKIYPAGSAANRTFTVRIAVDNPDRLLRPQMYARGRIETERHASVVLIPHDAVLVDEGSDGRSEASRLFTVEQGVAHDRKVTLGLSSADGKQVEATGIQAGTQIVVAGHRGLSDGAKVAAKPVNLDSATRVASK